MITYTKHNMGFSLLFLKGSSRMGMPIGYCTEKKYMFNPHYHSPMGMKHHIAMNNGNNYQSFP